MAGEWRDLWLGLAEINAVALKHLNPQIREAAARIQIMFDLYGNVAKKPYSAETSAVYGILQELRSRYAAELGALAKAELDAAVKKIE